MPTLTGTLADVTGTTIPVAAIREIFVKAPVERPSSASMSGLTVERKVTVTPSETLSVNLEPGPAVLSVWTDSSRDTFDLMVTANMTTLREAVVENAGELPEFDQSMLVELARQVREDAVAADASASAAASSASSSLGSKNAAASSASAAAGSATTASTKATEAAVSASGAQTARTGAETARTGAETARSGAEAAKTAADGSKSAAAASAADSLTQANRAQGYAEDFDLSVSGTTTGAPGSAASVSISGDGPAYSLSFSIPRGEKGDEGDTGTAAWADITGKPSTFPSTIPEIPGLTDALANAGSNNAADLAGALTASVDASNALVVAGGEPSPLGALFNAFGGAVAQINSALDDKADASHTHTKDQVGLGNVDNTSDAAKPVSTAVSTALSGKADASRLGGLSFVKLTQAAYNALGTKDANTMYVIVG